MRSHCINLYDCAKKLEFNLDTAFTFAEGYSPHSQYLTSVAGLVYACQYLGTISNSLYFASCPTVHDFPPVAEFMSEPAPVLRRLAPQR